MASETRLADLQRRLEQHGWHLARISGSHHIFKGEGRPFLSIPVHKGRVKPIYVRQVERAIEDLRQQEG